MKKFIAVIALSVFLSHGATPPAQAARVLVIRNTSSAISQAIADDYSALRGVTNVLNVACQDAAVSSGNETMTFKNYLTNIDAPLRAYLAAHPGIDFIVMTKGIPIRLMGSDAGGWVRADSAAQRFNGSLDSYVAALGYDTIKGAIHINISSGSYQGSSWANRYFNSTKRFSHAVFGGYLVTRLDGYTAADAESLVVKSIRADSLRLLNIKPSGKILLDESPNYGFTSEASQPFQTLKLFPPVNGVSTETYESNYGDYNADMARCHDTILKPRKIPDSLNANQTFVGNMTGLMGYISWGSNDGAYNASNYLSLRFAPGAIVETAVSTGARTFLPTQGGQSLVVDIIHNGATGMKGYCDEPWLEACAQPDILFSRYTSGWTLAESYYAASNQVSWEDIIIGDPLCVAYPDTTTSTTGAFPNSFELNPAAPISISQDNHRVVFTVGGNQGISRVSIVIISAQGRIVEKLASNDQAQSLRKMVWNLKGASGNRVQPGVYEYRISQENGTTTRFLEGTVTVAR